MKKLLLILVMFLLPFQYTWAMVANYDTHSTHDSKAHFGHHEHQSVDNHFENIDAVGNNQTDTDTDNAKNHVHYGFLHLSCGVVLSQCLPVSLPEDNQYSNQYLFNYHSPPSNAPERPNWLAPV